ncbi:hypothetical protein [Magnetospirillum sp. UT-4]|uniref:hypothetical protein n=1 Tax=Magnetospirillum sp. UT-4 TaxID=2681467 RepID=UPI001573610E|nr:hypothetical protein [Magnetospirillum sp. UT-4]
MKVAVIGSFKQHYPAVKDVIGVFRDAGLHVTSPAGSDLAVAEVDFVRFETDRAEYSDAEIQAVTLCNIFEADAIYVVAPGGYVGRTTCYEIGRIIQAGKPLYVSETIKDLPIQIPSSHVISAVELGIRFAANDVRAFTWDRGSVIADAEARLVVSA